MKKINFLNLAVKSRYDLQQYLKIFRNFLKKGVFVLGEGVDSFEKKFSKYNNKKFSIGVSSGTNALYLALKTLGVSKGDEVIVPCMSWYSTFTAVTMLGGIPIGVDIGNDLQLDQEKVLDSITNKTKAIIYVHFTGLSKSLKNLKKICNKKKIFLVEDCAQSFGATTKGIKVGHYSDIASYSMNPMKVFGAIGDAGMISTNKRNLFNTAKVLRYAGVDMQKDDCKYPDLNNKIDTLQALILNHKLPRLKKVIKQRIANAKIYNRYLTSDRIIKPVFKDNFEHIYYTYVIRVKKRDQLMKFLQKKNIETKVQHKKTIYEHSGLRKYNIYKSKFKKADLLKKEILCLPVHENLSRTEILIVCKLINSFKF